MTCKTDLVDHQRTQMQILSADKSRWENIGDIMDVKPPKASRNKDDVTTLADDDKTIVPAGPREHSDVTATLLKRTSSLMQKRLELSSYNQTCERFRIIAPDARHTTTEFSGYIAEYGDNTDPQKKTRIDMTITISGKVGKYDDDGYITPEFYTEGPALSFPLTPVPVAPTPVTPVTPTPVTPTPTATPLVVNGLTVAPTTLSQGQVATVTVTFNQAVSGLTEASFVADNATVSNVQTTDNGITWTATLTPNDGVDNATGTLKLIAGSYTTADGQVGIANTSGSYVVDTTP